jgi:hypothetical protein
MRLDPKLKEFGNESQSFRLDKINELGSYKKASQALGVSQTALKQSVAILKRNAALRGYAPDNDMSKIVPDGFKVKGVSTYYNREGKASGQWVKSSADEERREQLIKEMFAVMAGDVPRLPKIDLPVGNNGKDLLNVIPMGDPHIGLYAWAAECGEDFDTEEARRITLGAVDRLMESAPNAETCIILPLGDVFHANDQSNVTPGHKHQLDVDTRFVKVLGIGIETYRHAIIRALEKHPKVIVRFVSGNHDPQAIWALAFTIQAFFSDNPRVTVDLSPSKFWFHQFGNVLIGATHGDTVKHEALLGVMACDQSVAWGSTKHRYWYTGHVHHQSVKEFPGVICESFRTLAAKDAYAAGHGYRAGRDMVCITQHRLHGEVERHRCDIGML